MRINLFKIKLLLTVGVLSMLQVFPLRVLAQQQEIGNPHIKNYLPEEYKAHVQNFDIVQDTRGLMYFANFSGVLEYDGQNWRTIQTSLISQVTSLAIDGNGTIYVGGRGELGFLQADQFGNMQFISLTDSLENNDRYFEKVINVQPTNKGVYFVTNVSVLFWDGNSFVSRKFDGQINSAFYVNQRLYFYESNIGLNYIENNQVYKVNTSNKLSKAIVIKAMIPFGVNEILIGTNSNGFLLLGENGITKFNTNFDNYLINNILSCGILLSDGTLALGTERGGLVISHPDGSLKQIVNSGIQTNNISQLFVDNNNILWMALDNGIARVEVPSCFSFFDERKGIEGGVRQVIRNYGNLFFATNKGLFTFNNSVNSYRPVSGINSTCWSIIPDGSSIMAATSKGVFLVKNSQTKLIAPGFSIILFRSKIDSSTVYVGQMDGISKIQKVNGKWFYSGPIHGVSNEISEIEEDNLGNLWLVSATRGLIRITSEGKVIPDFYDDEKKGLPSRFGNHINSVEKNLLVTTQNGIYQYITEADSFSQAGVIGNDTLMPKEWLSKIVDGQNGNIWNNAGDQKQIKLRKNFKEDTLVQKMLSPVQSITISSIYPETDGIVWFSGPDGTIRFDQSKQKDFSVKPKTLIRSVKIKGDSILFGGTEYKVHNKMSNDRQPIYSGPNLDYSFNTLMFEFSCPSFSINEQVNFRYKLEGFDNNWSEWIDEVQKEYTNLPPGNYKFIVQARNIYRSFTEPANYQFSIRKPFYQTIFALILYALILAFIVTIVIRQRSKKLIKEKKNLENLINERTAEVVNQKEEIEKQSVELSDKNNELEKINQIVKSINSEINSSSLCQSILEKTRVISGVEKASMLVRDKSIEAFIFKAGYGWDVSVVENVRLTLNEADEYYLKYADEVYEDIFDVKKLNLEMQNESLRKMDNSKAMLIMTLKINDLTEGFLILENMHKKRVFDVHDFSLLNNLKEHIISAFIKTNILEDLQTTLEHLKDTQEQLIRQEKLASIGQLTKGIVDRILNPLNYINNFSLLTDDLAAEIKEAFESSKEEMDFDTYNDVTELLGMVQSNVQKINEHGNSASRIIKGMEKLLQKKSTVFRQTDINSLLGNNIEIALQEYKSENKSFNANIVREFENNTEKIMVLPAELGAVIVNTINNACFATDEKAKKGINYQPEIFVSSHFFENDVEIRIKDNGNGIPESERRKIFSPFFTTKPTSKGTGLGLYMNMDIVKSHKGTIEVDSKVGEFTIFIIRLPKDAGV